MIVKELITKLSHLDENAQVNLSITDLNPKKDDQSVAETVFVCTCKIIDSSSKGFVWLEGEY